MFNSRAGLVILGWRRREVRLVPSRVLNTIITKGNGESQARLADCRLRDIAGSAAGPPYTSGPGPLPFLQPEGLSLAHRATNIAAPRLRRQFWQTQTLL